MDKLRWTALAGAALALAGCGASTSSLTTGSLFGGGQATAATAATTPEPPSSDPTSRALQVAATSVRAQKCGYFFDPVKLKANFLAAEAKGGLAGEQLARLEREYDYTAGAIGRQLASNPDYCSDQRTAAIKASLTRHLAGDYNPPARKGSESAGGLFGDLLSSNEPRGREVLNPDWVKDPNWASKTKRVED